METRALGGDGPPLSRLGLGMAALGRPAYIVLGHDRDFPAGRSREAMERHAHAVLDAAFGAGVRYLDCARSYGEAEAFVRSWLDARGLAPVLSVGREAAAVEGPGAVTVGSKWGYRYVGAWRLDAATHEVKDHSAGALAEQLARSREVLGPHLALYQIHSATEESGVLDDAAVLDALAALRDAGVRVGLSTSGPRQAVTIRRALSVSRGGAPLFASVQSTWNVLERAAEDALREAHAAGRTVLVKEALANGRLTARGAEGRAGPLADVARARGVTPDAVALAAALAQPWADVVLLGAATVEQLRSNVAALGIALDAGELAALAPMAQPPEAYWRERAGLAWR